MMETESTESKALVSDLSELETLKKSIRKFLNRLYFTDENFLISSKSP